MSYKIFLDDERNPKDVKWLELPLGPWEIVRTYNDFVSLIRDRGMPSFISFDHDLADEHYAKLISGSILKEKYENYQEKTGWHCAKFIVDICIESNSLPPPFIVHSQNPIGKENIEKLLNGYMLFMSPVMES